jgi:hypothetical protein
MNIDLGFFIYLVFLAIILYGNHLKKRKQARQRAAQQRKTADTAPSRVITPSTPMQSQRPDLEWLDTLWGKKKPEDPAPLITPVKKSLHDQRREKQLQQRRVASEEGVARFPGVSEHTVHGVGRRVPIAAARFKTRDDLRRAIVARVVFAPPKSLE